jgi:hypothetical protein
MKIFKMERTLVLGMLLALGACGDDADTASMLGVPGPEDGTMVLSVTSPFDDDGAYSLELRGEGVTNVRAVGNGAELFTREAGGVITIAVLGAALSGEVVAFDVPDGRDPSLFIATLLEVADEENDVRRDLSAYNVAVSVTR